MVTLRTLIASWACDMWQTLWIITHDEETVITAKNKYKK